MTNRAKVLWPRVRRGNHNIANSNHGAGITESAREGRFYRLTGYLGRLRLGVALGLLVAGVAVLAQQAFDPDASLLDAFAPDTEATAAATSSSFISVPDQTPVSLSAELPVHNPAVGKLAGEAATSGGAATYSIPIVVPPGRRGLQPQLALSYSSRAGNGVAGMGWSLSGLSSIHRCPPTLDQDGVVRAVQMNANDKLCLDGQRLVVTAGTYGQSGAIYATELNTFSRVTQLGGALNSTAAYFTVETKAGDIVYYGGNSTAVSPARVIPSGVAVPLSWLIERRQDRPGNLLRYAYTSYGDGETLVASIFYTGFGSADGDRKVEFVYAARPTSAGSNDQASSYLAGGLTRQTQRLSTIVTKVAAQSVREYRLDYGTTTSATSGRSLLRSVQDCAYAGAVATCRPATQFNWRESAVAPTFKRFTIDGFLASNDVTLVREAGDFDGDGVRELIVRINDATALPYKYRDYLVSMTADRVLRGAIKISDIAGLDSQMLAPDRYGDFNQDGRTDITFIRVSGGVSQIVVGTWNATTQSWVPSGFTAHTLGIALPAPLGTQPCATMQAGDVNGDGLTDVVLSVPDGTSCPSGVSNRRLKVYLGLPSSDAGLPAISSTPAVDRLLPSAVAGGVQRNFDLERLTDFNGDGLLDVFLTRTLANDERDQARMLWLGNGAGTYALGGTGFEIGSFAALASPALATDEVHRNAYAQWLDVNGDGLEDLITAKLQSGTGYWAIRLNRQGVLGAAIVTSSRRGLEMCVANPYALYADGCGDRFRPVYAPQFTLSDVNADGRLELQVPRAFAARICVVEHHELLNGEFRSDHYCPENPLTGAVGAKHPDMSVDDRLLGSYSSGGGSMYTGGLDPSAYFMDVLQFAQTGAASFRVDVVPTNLVHGGRASRFDLYGDGLEDEVSYLGYPFTPDTDGLTPYVEGYAFVHPTDPTWGPASLPDATAVSSLVATRKFFIAEHNGAGARVNLPPHAPDMLALVTDGLGVETTWEYYPLSSKAGRTTGETPFYSLPTSAAARYIDDRHFYFTSSMPVVADMVRSDGIGDYRAWCYGYAEAMYHARGRGFQGFRTIVEEDEAGGTRSTTTFHQKFPLTSQPEQIIVNSLKRSATLPPVDPVAPISKQVFTWRCNRANRADAAACVAPSGTATVQFPFLDTQETWTYDAAVADNPTGGTPLQIAYRKQVAADDTTCAGAFASTSGYDANGNLTASTVLSYDSNTGTGGYRAFVASHCLRTRASYAAADTANWWLDKLTARSVTTAITYNATNHALPTGVANPQQTVATAYTWNANRTPATQTVQSGVTNQQRVTTYGYPASNYGLPSSVSVTASGDPNGARTVSTTYSTDGYFPLKVTNPLAHQTTTVTRPEDGQPSQVTDANGLRTLLQYDAFGFNTLIQYRGATDAEVVAPDQKTSLGWCLVTACQSTLTELRTTVVVVQDGAPTRYTYLDRFSRKVWTAERLADATWSRVLTDYDAVGRVSAQSEPYRLGSTIYKTRFPGYDLLGRPTQKIAPQANHDGRGDLVTTYAYSGRQTAIQVCGSADPDASKCLALSRTTDSLGRYVETVDAKNGVTRFWYDGSGNALAIKDAKASIISASYNAIGQRTGVNDPNQGVWSFGYNALGEVLSQTDARAIATTSSYDKLGRPTQRSASYDYDGVAPNDSVLDSWSYDPAYGKGQEASNSRKVNTTVLRSAATSYDALSRPIMRAITQLRADNTTAVTVTQETSYDVYYGRPKAQSYGNAEAVWLRYSKYGHLTRESDANGGADYRYATVFDARGHATTEALGGSALSATRSYLPQTGQVGSIQYASVANPNLRKLDYAYDVFGNLGQQSLNTGQVSETYTYDALQRLTDATRIGAATGTVTYAFDAVGNFTAKSDFSTTAASAYAYTGGSCGGGPHAVKTVALAAGGSRTYCYDAAGNLTSDNAGLALQYDHTQRPLKITRGAVTQRFDYGPDGARFRQSGSDGEVAYFGALERRYTPTANDKTYVGSAVVTQTGAARRVDYVLTDRLGSVDAVADANGSLIETRGYDAFGKPRTGTWANATPPRLGTTSNTPHGFTGHEHLNTLELIHMNGRVYDYNIGRFTGVDPVIQFPLNSQSLNPYSYLLNNPLSGTDPTGYAMECLGGGWVCQQAQHQALRPGESSYSGSGKNDMLGRLGITGGQTSFRPWLQNGARSGNVSVGTPAKVEDKEEINAASGRSQISEGATTGPEAPQSNDRADPHEGLIPTRGNPPGYSDGRFSAEGRYRTAPSGKPKPHYGRDTVGDIGDRVVSAKNGEVFIVGRGNDWGNYVIVKSQSSDILGRVEFAVYAHLNAISVSRGSKVSMGEDIGTVGRSGNASMPHLHFEISYDGYSRGAYRVDPVEWLERSGQ